MDEVSARPIAFPEVVGHVHASAMLSRALARGQLHHGLLLHGPRGIGKSTLARGLGCALLCRQAPAVGCGTCATCQRILADRHTDVVFIAGEGKNRGIKREQIRELVIACQSAPYEGDAHLVVIDPADLLTIDAANVLLKTLEEPRPGVYFALLTSNVDGVLATLRSRTLAVGLGRLSDDEVAGLLAKIHRDRGLDLPAPDQMTLAIALAEGSPGTAWRLLNDPSLLLTREVLSHALQASRQGASGIFSGDQAPLWQAFQRAVIEARELDDEEASEEPVVVVVSKGSKRSKAEKAPKAAPKASTDDDDDPGGGKQSPAKQRLAMHRLLELWLLHLRESMRGRHTFAELPDLRSLSMARQVGQMRLLERLQHQLDANANVRLAFEVALLQLHPLLRDPSRAT